MLSSAVVSEQDHLDQLYRRLQEMRERAVALRDDTRRATDGTPAGLFNRDALQHRYSSELAALSAAEDRLCFGRLDSDDGEQRHIGRMGITDGTPERRQLLIDWRAPAAAPFYTATALNPMGVLRRRHIKTRRRRVESVSDEYLQATGSAPELPTDDLGVGGDSALLEALNAPRTGRMGDIIETIQAEQDAIIRADRNGILVVQGGPGTGKTVVALHRAAYLLYTYRERLGSHGVLVIGPSQTFLDYIGQVLPSLGESSVLLATVGTMLPGVVANGSDAPAGAELKGRAVMADVIDNALLDRQRMPHRVRTVAYDRGTVRLEPSLLRSAQRRAWGSRLPHNRARQIFVRAVLNGLARQVKGRPGVRQLEEMAGPAEPDDIAEIRQDLATDPGVVDALSGLWPALTPQQLVADLLGSPRRLAFAAPMFSGPQRDALRRSAAAGWTSSDVPLLDEAAELLGEVSTTDRALAAARRAELDYAREALDTMGAAIEGQDDSGIGFTIGMVSAADLAARHEDGAVIGPTADRAAADREWTFGHVIIDEAQELSAMAWRMVMRRVPVKSMTVVGDIAQASDPAAASSWAAALDGHARGRWRLSELTVNYRTPAEIMRIAEPVLAVIDASLAPPTSVRESGLRPWARRADADGLLAAVAAAVAGEAAGMSAGQLAVLHSGGDGEGAALLAAVRELLPDAAGAAGPGQRVVVLAVHESKGLEFDSVILVEPARIAGASPRGLSDLYVALTRATQRLGIVHSQALPVAMSIQDFAPAR